MEDGHVISGEILVKVLNYLATKPWDEVNEIIDQLKSLPEFKATKTEEG